MDIKAYRKVLFPVACLFLIIFSFNLNSLDNNFAIATLAASFALLIVEALILIFKSHASWWGTVKWFILALLLLLTLIG